MSVFSVNRPLKEPWRPTGPVGLRPFTMAELMALRPQVVEQPEEKPMWLHVTALIGGRTVRLGSASKQLPLGQLLREAKAMGATGVEVGGDPSLGFPNGIFSGDYEVKVLAAAHDAALRYE